MITLEENPIYKTEIRSDDNYFKTFPEGEEVEVNWEEPGNSHGSVVLRVARQAKSETELEVVKVVDHYLSGGFYSSETKPRTVVYYPGLLSAILKLFNSVGTATVTTTPCLVGYKVINLKLNEPILVHQDHKWRDVIGFNPDTNGIYSHWFDAGYLDLSVRNPRTIRTDIQEVTFCISLSLDSFSFPKEEQGRIYDPETLLEGYRKFIATLSKGWLLG